MKRQPHSVTFNSDLTLNVLTFQHFLDVFHICYVTQLEQIGD